MRRDAEPALDDVLAHADFVRGVARAVLGGDDRVEDVVQDTWLAAARQRPRRASALRAWLAVVARNLAYRVLRGSKRRALRERKAARTEGLPDAAEIAEREEVRSRLVAALLALEEPYRSALLLRYYDDLSVPEVALRLGVPLETARTRLRRGLDRLRERLGARRPDTRRSLAVLVAPSAVRSGPSPWPALLGVVAVKKALAVAVAVLLLVGLGWTVLGPWITREKPAETTPSQAAVLESRDATPTLAAPAAPTVRAPAVEATPSATGRVVDGAGAPVAGARVLAWRDDMDVVVDPAAPAGGPTGSTRTDASGTFRVPLEGKAPGFTLLATATGFAPAAVTGVQAGDDVTIALPAAVSIHGTVRDLEERPIAGARVAWTGFVGGAKFTAETVTGADGAYRLRGLTPGAFHSLLRDSLVVSAEGYAPVRTSRAKAGAVPSGAGASDGSRWDVWLGRGATIRGRVVDADSGGAVAFARVVLWSEQEVAGLERPDGTALLNPAYYAAVGDVRTSEDGTFTIEHAPAWGAHLPGTWIGSALQRRLGRLGAVADDYATTTQEVRVPAEGEVTEIEVRLTSAGTVRGRVLRPDGAPAAGATVWWDFASGTSWRSIPPVFAGLETKPCVTDTNGRYLLVGVAARHEAAEVVHVSGAAPGASAWAPRASVDVTPRAGELVDAPDLVLAPSAPDGPAALLTVVDESGRPVFGATFEGGIPGARTDETGRAQVYFHAGSRDVTVNVRASGRAPVTSPTIRLAAGTFPEVRVVLGPRRPPTAEPVVEVPALPADGPRGVTLEGTIRDAKTGRPLLKWDVVLSVLSDRLGARPTGPGRFRLENVPDGTWDLRAQAEGYEPEVGKQLRVEAGTSATSIDIRLTPGLRIHGRVRDETGAPVGGVHVFLNGQGVPGVAGTTTPDGQYDLHGIRAGGRYTAWLARDDGRGGMVWWASRPFEDVLVPGDATTLEHDLNVVPAGALNLSVRSELLQSLASEATKEQRDVGAATRLTLEEALGATSWTTLGVWQGRRSIVLPAGRWTVRVEVPGAPAREAAFTIVAGKTEQVTIDVP